MTETNNFVGIYDNVYSKEWCDSVIKYFHRMEDSGLTITRKQQRSTDKRTQRDDMQLYVASTLLFHENFDGSFHREFYSKIWNEAYAPYADKYDILAQYGRHDIISPKIQKTEIGGGYHMWHAENELLNSSHRLLTYTVYLNDVDEGGETELLYYPIRIKPKTGRVVIFPANFTHTHRGNPPISNTKYIITGWINLVGGES